MTEKLDKLTEKQLEKTEDYVNKWSKLGLSTQPVDRDHAARAISNLYARAGLKRPSVIFLPDPLSAGLSAICYAYQKTAKREINIEGKTKKSLDKMLVTTMGDGASAKVLDPIRKRMNKVIGLAVDAAGPKYDGSTDILDTISAIRSQIADNEHNSTTEAIRKHITTNLDSVVTQKVEYLIDRHVEPVADVTEDITYQALNEVGDDSMHRVLHSYFGGSLWNAAYCSWADYLSTTLKIDVPRDFMDLTTHAGYFWTLDGVVFASDHPTMINFDQERRMHAERGASVKYDSGWGIYHWRGTLIPGEWVEDKGSLTAAKALAVRNVEQRRSACEIFGWSNILRDLKAKVINSDPDPLIGTLVEVQLTGLRTPARFLRVHCGTGREFAIPVDPRFNTAMDAQAWLVGLEPKDYKLPEVRA